MNKFDDFKNGTPQEVLGEKIELNMLCSTCSEHVEHSWFNRKEYLLTAICLQGHTTIVENFRYV